MEYVFTTYSGNLNFFASRRLSRSVSKNKFNLSLPAFLTEESLEEFRAIAKEDYGQDYSDEELIDQATRAVELAKLLDQLDLLENA